MCMYHARAQNLHMISPNISNIQPLTRWLEKELFADLSSPMNTIAY